jgi:NADPH-dependent 7-cyano-7-deazaguanine reductase QueF
MLRTLDLDVRVRVKIEASFSAVCPVTGTEDGYTAVIEYEGRGRYLELVSLRRYLEQFKEQRWFHEELCEKIARDLAAALGTPVKVTLRTNFQGVLVEVEKVA